MGLLWALESGLGRNSSPGDRSGGGKYEILPNSCSFT